MQHTCGYINLLRTGAPPQQQKANWRKSQAGTAGKKQPTTEEKAKQVEISDFLEDLKELGIGEPKSPPATTEQISTQEETGHQQNGTGTAESGHEQNGTGTASSKSPSDNTVGDASEADGGLYCEESMTPFQKKLLEEWVPLELSFGIPLFSDEANRTVCDKASITVMPNFINNLLMLPIICVS